MQNNLRDENVKTFREDSWQAATPSPKQLLKDIQPGTKVAWYSAADEVGRAIYDFRALIP